MAKRKGIDTDDPRVDDPIRLREKDQPYEMSDEELLAMFQKPGPHEDDEFQDRGDIDSMLATPADSKFDPIPSRKPVASRLPTPDDKSDPDLARQDKISGSIAEIKSLIDDLEKSQKEQSGRQGRARAQAFAINAGEAMRAGFAGERGNYVNPPPKYDKAQGKKEQIDLGDKLKNTQMNYQAKEDERELRKYLGDEGNETKIKTTGMTEAGKDQRQADKQAFDWKKTGYTESQKNERAKIMARASLVRAQWGQQSSASRGVGREAAQEEYSQNRMYSKGIPEIGKDFHARGAVTAHMSNNADERLKNYALLKPALDEARDLLEQDPSGMLFWGSDARARLDGAFAAAYQADTKFQGNGVMNGPDLLMSQRIIGDAASPEQFIANNGQAKIAAYADRIDAQLDRVMSASGYDPGKGSPKTLQETHDSAIGASGSASNPLTPADVNAADAYVTGKGPAPSPGSPQQPPDIGVPGQAPVKQGGRRVIRKQDALDALKAGR